MFARCAQALRIALAKVIRRIPDCDLLASADTPCCSDPDSSSFWRQLCVGVAIMVYKPRRPEEYILALPAAAINDAEVTPVARDGTLLLGQYINLSPIEVRNGTALRYVVPRGDAGFFTIRGYIDACC